ncbi:MAG: shikimate dehydrogenase [bacterium]
MDFIVSENFKNKYVCPLVLGIFGHNISYSISPLIHYKLGNILKLNLCYKKFDVNPDCFAEAFNGFKSLKLDGANITKPYKIEVMKYLDKLSKEAEIIGAVNTVKLDDNIYKGYNTDSCGFIKSVKYEFNFNLNNAKIIILGAGGASKAVLYSLLKEGASGIHLINRDIEKAAQLVETASEWNKYNNWNIKSLSYSNFVSETIKNVFNECDLIVNTITPSEESAKTILSLPFSELSKNSYAIDISYNPPETSFTAIMRKNQIKTANGFSMLVFQAIESFYIWTGKKPSFDFVLGAIKL